MNNPTVLVILDGFGHRDQRTYNAIAQADAPTINYLLNTYPHTLLQSSGAAVGLPPGSMGNSEVGHLTIGAGRIIKQAVVRINEMIAHGTLLQDPISETILNKTKKHTIHIMGLLSDANVHSNQNHLYAMLEALQKKGFSHIIIHPFLDGRDTPPCSAKRYLTELDIAMKKFDCGSIGSIHGRFYAMDRDHNWDRTEKSYTVLTQQQKPQFTSWQDALCYFYKNGITDEFILPTALHDNSTIKADDTVIFFNFRPDRARQLTAAFVSPKWNAFTKMDLPLSGFITPVQYGPPEEFPTHALLQPIVIQNTLKDVLNNHNITMFSIAETEKYAHVTYFFNGEVEQQLSNEERVFVPSIPAKNYVQKPEMSAHLITNAVLKSLKNDPKDFYLINYANADMVGHSGNMGSTIKAIECLDRQIEQLYKQIIIDMEGTLYITGDHGKAEYMFNQEENQPNTAHTTDPVPFIFIKKNIEKSIQKLPLHGLADIAPFILKNMNISIPQEMIHRE